MRIATRYLIVVLPAVMLAACSKSGTESAPAASAPMAAASSPVTATTSPAPGGTSPMFVATPLPTPLDWTNLSSQVGKYQNQIDLFEHGPISVELKKLLGDKLAVLKRNLEVAGPLQKAGDVYYLVGNAPHQGGRDQAYVLIDPAQQAVEVGLWQNGMLTTWQTPGTTIGKPGDVRTMLRNAQELPAGSASGPPKAAPSHG